MTSPIAYKPVTAPVETDYADGTTAYNAVAAGVEAGYDLTNSWARQAESAFASQPAVSGSAFFTPVSGWAMDTWSGRLTYGRKWGNITFVCINVTRTGANLAPSASGNITDTHIGTIIPPAYRPRRTQYLTAAYSGYSPCIVYLGSDGRLVLQAMGNGAVTIFVTNRQLFFCHAWVANDPSPI